MAVKRIDEHSLKVLEFEQIRQILASYAQSGPGRAAAAKIYPSMDEEWISRRLCETTEMKALLSKGDSLPLGGLSDIGPLFDQIGHVKTVFEPGDLLQIAGTLSVSGQVRKFFAECEPQEVKHLWNLASRLHDFTSLVEQIRQCIEDENTVKDDASEKLRQIRRQIEKLDAKIKREFKSIVNSSELKNAIENDKFLMRHGRAVVAIKATHRQSLRGVVLDRSNTGATLYVEPEPLVELSNELEDARYEEKKEIDRILWQLSQAVLDRKPDVLSTLNLLGLIDLTFAKARFSIAYNMTAPHITPDCSLSFRQARHPLLLCYFSQEKNRDVTEVFDDVVPIDIRLGDDFDLLLVTGPNTGGKTVLLKTIGLLVLMAQTGMHICAREDSQLGIYRQVFADIGDEQSIQQSLSTFSAHIKKIVDILKRTNDQTLVLLDELGAGTDPAEGSVLAGVILDRLLKKKSKTVATTHLGRLKSYAYTTSRAENASVQFDVNTLRPTYQVQIGTPGSSNAMIIAEKLGMEKSLIRQANQILEQDADGTSDLINQVQATREDAENKRLQSQQLLDEAKRIRDKAAEELENAKQKQQLISQVAEREIDKTMHQVNEAVDEFFDKVRNSPKPFSDYVESLMVKISELTAQTPLAVRQSRFIKKVRKGDTVYVAALRRNGIVNRIRRKKEVMNVFVETKEVEVPFTEIYEPDVRHR